jgi:(R,R)-butanediol dehydrogenase / meso-butanediol dehydrogenase / diacetyl reductase
MKAAVWYNTKDVRVEEREVKTVNENDVMIKVSWAGICGSDLHEYEKGPILIPTREAHFLTGEKGPITMGHEFSGIVKRVGDNVTNVKPGDRVVVFPVVTLGKHDPEIDRYYGLACLGIHGDGGFSEYFVTSKDQIIPIPEELGLDKAALVEPLSVSYQAMKEGSVKQGDVVAIFGCGPIGLLAIAAAKALGAKEIFAFDLSDGRLQKAKEIGATYTLNPKENDPVSFIKERYPYGVDASFEVAGVKQTFDQAIAAIKPKGTAVVIAIHAKNFEFNPISLASGVRLVASHGYSLETFKEAVNILIDRETNIDPIITKKTILSEIVNEGFETLLSDQSQAKILVEIGGEI